MYFIAVYNYNASDRFGDRDNLQIIQIKESAKKIMSQKKRK